MNSVVFHVNIIITLKGDKQKKDKSKDLRNKVFDNLRSVLGKRYVCIASNS
jgi:hypothetical protein